jgi:hypothetical protein
MDVQDFYSTAAQACFTLLGLWWVLLSFDFDRWVRDPLRRLGVYDVSLYFLLPGLMSLVSLLAVGEPKIWRVAFAIGGMIGAVESVILPIRRAPHGRAGLVVRTADWISFVLFGLIAAVAVKPSIVGTVGIDLRPLEVEGILIAILMAVGFGLGWLMFVARASESAPDVERPETPREPA